MVKDRFDVLITNAGDITIKGTVTYRNVIIQQLYMKSESLLQGIPYKCGQIFKGSLLQDIIINIRKPTAEVHICTEGSSYYNIIIIICNRN